MYISPLNPHPLPKLNIKIPSLYLNIRKGIKISLIKKKEKKEDKIETSHLLNFFQQKRKAPTAGIGPSPAITIEIMTYIFGSAKNKPGTIRLNLSNIILFLGLLIIAITSF